MKKPIIFLDIDGVINSRRTATAFGKFPWNVTQEYLPLFDQVAIELIRKVCSMVNAEMVLSSTWRLSVGYRPIAKALSLPIIGQTPVKFSGSRGQEIDAWLKDNPGRERYAIVDDDSDMLISQMPFFVKVDFNNGFSYENYKRLLEILGVEE